MHVAPVSTRIGPYEIISTLGSGAMGEVYLAHDSRLDRNVALKVISPASSNDVTRRRRFTAEARAASSLNHPNIITVHDFGSADGISYIVSELIEGESLRNLIQRGPIPIRELLEIAIQIADGLAAAHEAGIVHRDLKPENVMITKSGRVKILDFGLAKPILSSTEPQQTSTNGFAGLSTEPGLILGTVGYMSPEQARGADVRFESDQFSFGVLLHEMATGVQAFKRDTPMQTLLAIANVESVPFTPGPAAFRLLVGRCLAKDPDQRFASTADIRGKLQKILDGLPKPVMSHKTPEEEELESVETAVVLPASEPVRKVRPRWIVPAAVAVVAAFALGALAATMWLRSARVEASKYRFAPIGMSGAVDVFPALSPSGQSIAYSELIDGVFQIFTRRLSNATAIQRTQSQDDCFRPFWSSDGTRVYYVASGDLWTIGDSGGSPQKVLSNVANADLSPDGTTLALARRNAGGDESLWTMALGGSPQHVSKMPTFVATDLKYTPDGREVGVSTADAFWIARLDGKAAKRESAIGPRGFAWMRDGKHVLYGSDHLWIANVSGGKREQLTLGAGHENWPSVGADGRQAIFSTASPHTNLLAIQLGSEDTKTNVPAAAPYSELAPAWNPQKAEFAFVSTRNGVPEVFLRDAQSGWERALTNDADFKDPTVAVSGLAFSPDGHHLAFERTSLHQRFIWVVSVDGERPVRVAAGDGPVWSPDGNWIAYSSKTLMKIRAGGSAVGQSISSRAAQIAGWSADGAWLLVREWGGRLSLLSPDGKLTRKVGQHSWLAAAWLPGTGRVIGLRRGEDRHLQVTSVSPDGSDEKVEKDLGPYPGALSVGLAMNLDPVSGFSVSKDGQTILTALLAMESSLWRVDGL